MANCAPLRFLQANLNTSRSATALFLRDMIDHSYDLGLVQEPYLLDGKMVGLPLQWHLVHHPSSECRTAIAVRTRIDFQVLRISPHFVAISVAFAGRTFQLLSCYAPPSEPIDTLLTQLETHFAQFPLPCILVGDFNGWHPLWGSPQFNARGVELLHFITRHGLAIHNHPDSPPTFDSSRFQSWIDVTLSSSPLADLIEDWHVADRVTCSDHRHISFILCSHLPPRDTATSNRYHTKYADWTAFEVVLRTSPLLAQFISDLPTLGAEDSAVRLTQVLTTVCDSFFAKRRGSAGPSPWWTAALSFQRQRLRALRRRFQRQRDPTRRQAFRLLYHRAEARFKKAVLTAKMVSWRRYCSAVTTQRPFDVPYKIASGKMFKPAQFSALTDPQGGLTQTFPETMRILMDEHFSGTSLAPDALPAPSSTSVDPTFTDNELDFVLRHLPRNKAPGVDNLDLPIIRHFHACFPTVLLAIFNKCLQSGVFPSPWKKALVVFFNKTGKPPTEASSYRPICLLPTLGKILEKLIATRLMFHTSRNAPLSDAQFGFRTGRSTTDALNHVLQQIRTNREQGLHTSLVSLDVHGAFDHMRFVDILRALNRIACPANLFLLMRHYLQNRTVTLSTSTVSITRTLVRGCPQGSCLSPILWNLVLDPVLALPLGDDASVQAYADDLLLVLRGPSRRRLEDAGNVALQLLLSWCSERDLHFSPHKSQALTVATRGVLKRQPSFRLGPSPVPTRDTLKYLGILLDNRLSFLPHLRHVAADVHHLVFSLQRMARKTWGLPGTVLKYIYTAAIERRVLYAVGAWWRREANADMRRLLESIQRHPLLAITRAYRTTSTAALQVVAGCPPLWLMASQEAAFYDLKTSGVASHCHRTYSHSVEQFGRRDGLHPASFRLPPADIDAELPMSPDFSLFTDGSRSDRGCGSAFVVLQTDTIVVEKQFHLPDTATSFQAEVHALQKAFSWILDHFEDESLSFLIASDSRSALQAICNPFSHNTSIHHVQDLWRSLVSHHDIALRWVPGHRGIMGNERADSLARSASARPPDCTVPLPVARRVAKSQLRDHSLAHWQTLWTDGSTGRLTHAFCPTVSPLRLVADPLVVQLVTGHGAFPSYLVRFHCSEEPACACGALGDVRHFLFDCPLTSGPRGRLWAACPSGSLAAIPLESGSPSFSALRELMTCVADITLRD